MSDPNGIGHQYASIYPFGSQQHSCHHGMEVYVVGDHFRCDPVASQNRSPCPWLPVIWAHHGVEGMGFVSKARRYCWLTPPHSGVYSSTDIPPAIDPSGCDLGPAHIHTYEQTICPPFFPHHSCQGPSLRLPSPTLSTSPHHSQIRLPLQEMTYSRIAHLLYKVNM